MTVALQQLRQAIISGQTVTHDDTAIILNGAVRLPRTDSTNFRSLHGRGAPYTLETIYFQYQFREYPYNEYFQSCKDKGVPHAFLIDKKDLLAYLSGAIDTCDSITDDAPAPAASEPGLPPDASADHAASRAGAPASPTSRMDDVDGVGDQQLQHAQQHQFQRSAGDRDRPGRDRTGAGDAPAGALGAGDAAGDGSDGTTTDKAAAGAGAAKAGNGAFPRAAAPRDCAAERSRKRERDQCVLDASFTVIGWDYSQLRDKLVSSLAANRRLPSGSGGGAKGGGGANGSASKFDPRGDRYTNNEGRFWRENLGSDFNEMDIDMSGSFKAKPKTSSQNGGRDQRASGSGSGSGRGGGSGSGGSGSGSGGGGGGPQGPQSRSGGSSRDQERKKMRLDPEHRKPIVLVPSGDTSLVTAMNVIEFMRDGHFLTREEMQKKGVPVAQPARKAMRRKPGGNCSQAEYLVVSNPTRMHEREWDQVVAVVCSGQTWQFKKWPLFKGSAQQLFHSVQGFYFHFDDSPPKGEVREWPVKLMSVSRDKRHTDGSLNIQFWRCLDSYIARKKAHLRY